MYNSDFSNDTAHTSRSTVYGYDPELLVLVDDKSHPLFDERVKWEPDEAMVRNIIHHGVLEPVIARKNSETGQLEVVDGRQRVSCTREANRRLREQGSDIILVPTIIRKTGDDGAFAGVMVSANEIRREDTPVNKAMKMERLITLGRDENQLALLFGISKQTVGNYLSLLKCTAEVRKAVDTGKIPVSEAYKLAKLAPDLQRETVTKMVEVGATATTKREKVRKMREVSGMGPKLRRKKEVDTFYEKIEDKCFDPAYKAAVLAVLKWVVGGAEPRFPRRPPPVVIPVPPPTSPELTEFQIDSEPYADAVNA